MSIGSIAVARPLLLAILGEVYDVGPGERHYAPGQGYSGMAGRDASRSFTTGNFKKDAVPGLLNHLTS